MEKTNESNRNNNRKNDTIREMADSIREERVDANTQPQNNYVNNVYAVNSLSIVLQLTGTAMLAADAYIVNEKSDGTSPDWLVGVGVATTAVSPIIAAGYHMYANSKLAERRRGLDAESDALFNRCRDQRNAARAEKNDMRNQRNVARGERDDMRIQRNVARGERDMALTQVDQAKQEIRQLQAELAR